MGVWSGEVELELTRPLPDRHCRRYTPQIHLKLARSRLDGQREGSPLLAKLQLVAGNAAEDGREVLEGWSAPEIRTVSPSSTIVGGLAGRVVAGTGYPGFPLTGFGFEVAGR